MVKLAQMLAHWFTPTGDTIMIAEPDPLLRRLERRALSPRYKIVETSSAEEAVRTAARRKGTVDLLLTEVRLPRIDGWDLAGLLRLDYPNLKVVYLSGSMDAEIRAHTRRSPVLLLDRNRFRPESLRSVVREVLETRRKDRAEFKVAVDSLFSRFRRGWAKLHI